MFAQSVRFAGVVIGRGAEAELGGLVGVALGGGEEGRGGWEGLLGVRVFGGGCMVGSASEELGAGLSGLLFSRVSEVLNLEVACERGLGLWRWIRGMCDRAYLHCLRGLFSDGRKFAGSRAGRSGKS